MGQRINLQQILEKICPNVYFQPPSSPQMSLTYPCIVYSRDSGDSQYADDLTYIYNQRYQVQVIARDPDYVETIQRQLLDIPTCRSDRHYTSDNLHHDTFILYY